MHPYLPDGGPEGLKKALNDLHKRKIDIVVPGHGDVGNSDICS
jgi:glyoxylase-like metal-dependent hydrolase (beta-lactamase superfamily II)